MKYNILPTYTTYSKNIFGIGRNYYYTQNIPALYISEIVTPKPGTLKAINVYSKELYNVLLYVYYIVGSRKLCLKYFLQEVPYLQCEPCLIKSYYIAYLPSPFIIVHMVQHYLFIG